MITTPTDRSVASESKEYVDNVVNPRLKEDSDKEFNLSDGFGSKASSKFILVKSGRIRALGEHHP